MIVAMTPLIGCGTPAQARIDPVKQLTEFTKPDVSGWFPVNQPGTVNKEWLDGLTLFWEDYYSKAMPIFEDV